MTIIFPKKKEDVPTKDYFVYFFSNSCPPCKELKKPVEDIFENSEEKMVKINIEDENAMESVNYSNEVTYVPMIFRVEKNGQKIRWEREKGIPLKTFVDSHSKKN